MPVSTRVVRRFDLPPAVVWAALVDPALQEGWLHPVARLVDPDGGGDPRTDRLEEPHALDVASSELGHLSFALEPEDRAADALGGTRLELDLLDVDPALRAAAVATWRTRLDQLDELLRGRPVDWDAWADARRPAYDRHLAEARRTLPRIP